MATYVPTPIIAQPPVPNRYEGSPAQKLAEAEAARRKQAGLPGSITEQIQASAAAVATKPFPGSVAESVPAQTIKDAIPWIVVAIGVAAGLGSAWYYYKKMR